MPVRSQTFSLKTVSSVPFIIILPDLLFMEKLVSVEENSSKVTLEIKEQLTSALY